MLSWCPQLCWGGRCPGGGGQNILLPATPRSGHSVPATGPGGTECLGEELGIYHTVTAGAEDALLFPRPGELSLGCGHQGQAARPRL